MKNKFNICLIMIIVVMVLGASSILLIHNFSSKKEDVPEVEEKNSKNNPLHYDYRYILSYDYLTVNYNIYLLKNDEIKVVSKQKLFEVCPGENCMKETGEVSIEEHEINLSEKALEKARNVISSFFANGNSKEIDLLSYNLDNKVKLVLDGIIENNSDKILLNDEIKIESHVEEVKNKKGNVVFNHSYDNIVDSKNIIIKNIAEHINGVVNKDFKTILDDSKELSEYMEEGLSLGVSLALKIECITEDEISISYTTEGSLGGVNWYVKKGYVYSTRDGKIKEYYDSKKEIAHSNAIKAFENSELYKTNSDQLYANYESVLKSEMFKTGNYYITDSKVIFVVEGYLLGFDEATAKMVEIEIERDKNY